MRKLRVLLALCVMAACFPAWADVVIRKGDNYRFEGEIIAQGTGGVTIDTMVSGIRATVTIKRDEVKSVEMKPVTPGFYDPPRAAARMSDPLAFTPTDTLYLEVPIAGKFGEQVFADGVKAVLTYAERNRVKHIVFVIDSAGWNNIDEAVGVFRCLRQAPKDITLHAIIKNCTGDALSVASLCDTIVLVPGATVGGATGEITKTSRDRQNENEDIIRQQIAAEVSEVLKEHGRPGVLVKSMIDPTESTAVWRNEQGQIVAGEQPPADLPGGKLIIQSKPGEFLVMTYDQGIQLGMPKFTGGAKELGAMLGLQGWRMESVYGSKAMSDMRNQKQASAAAKSAAYEAKVTANITRRETTDRAMKYNLQMAEENDPQKGSYKTKSGTSSNGWGWDTYYESSRFTQESIDQWKRRTAICAGYLKRAAQAVTAMKKLDQEAVALGLEPTYKDAELDMMADKMNTRYKVLQAEHGKIGY